MSEFYNQSRANSRRSDYVWQYEYYDDEDPVSFEGLKAHRYSIVIGFWVGLAVFVIFMFFVLTLLTKTGAPHQENPEPAEKRHRLGNCVVDINSPQEETDKVFSRPLLAESHALLHFYVSEEEQARGQSESGAQAPKGHRRLKGMGSYGREDMVEEGEQAEALQPLQGLTEETKLNKERVFLPQFNIPNFVTSDHSSTLEDDDLLLCEPAVTLANNSQSHAQDGHGAIN